MILERYGYRRRVCDASGAAIVREDALLPERRARTAPHRAARRTAVGVLRARRCAGAKASRARPRTTRRIGRARGSARCACAKSRIAARAVAYGAVGARSAGLPQRGGGARHAVGGATHSVALRVRGAVAAQALEVVDAVAPRGKAAVSLGAARSAGAVRRRSAGDAGTAARTVRAMVRATLRVEGALRRGRRAIAHLRLDAVGRRAVVRDALRAAGAAERAAVARPCVVGDASLVRARGVCWGRGGVPTTPEQERDGRQQIHRPHGGGLGGRS